MAAAQVREACTIPGTSVRTAWLCRDKPSMKEALRAAGDPDRRLDRRHAPPPRCTRSPTQSATRSSSSRAPAPARWTPPGSTTPGRARRGAGPRSAARASTRSRSRSSSRATRASTTPSRSTAHAALDFVSHYYPNVLEAMRTRWISPQFISTNRVDTAGDYQQLRELGAPGQRRARHRHQRDPHGVVLRPEGAAVLRDRLPAARRRRVGPLLGGQRHRHLPRLGGRDRARARRRAALAPVRRRHRRAAARTATARSAATPASTRRRPGWASG